ncbi:hypothetical protein CIB48_g372 [Xylaria polymorpha]|nr:hypothetical protein CIB48_g372 [Xylaria polymorpha]
MLGNFGKHSRYPHDNHRALFRADTLKIPTVLADGRGFDDATLRLIANIPSLAALRSPLLEYYDSVVPAGSCVPCHSSWCDPRCQRPSQIAYLIARLEMCCLAGAVSARLWHFHDISPLLSSPLLSLRPPLLQYSPIIRA